MKPDHNHVINREAVAVKVWLAGKLTEEQKDQVAKMTGEHRTCGTVQRPYLDSRSFFVLSCHVPRSVTRLHGYTVTHSFFFSLFSRPRAGLATV